LTKGRGRGRNREEKAAEANQQLMAMISRQIEEVD
jgi:hypothetical protein